ncbi:proteasome subunit alpha 4 [Natronoarchaeum philippinense]|uniref:Proteasome subunit alpha n=1 Tax=Natronoarchaeum philippinense TaxID=558529 RepID=A0A285P6I5_NATPI|nr:archaeal proteasome endopeptidase complex subunit alpha [Natronoarchaeum philippinense]SNZ17342.1 proteasome subunit alpha 4 [Natronoarchaeum philippinense]
MQGQHNQQAYDRGITIFSPDGRLYQVEYAREAVKRGTATIGVRTPDGVALVADRSVRSRLIEPESVEKLHEIDDHVGVASAGHVADARKLVDFARRRAQTEQLRYGESIGVETLAKSITDNIQEHTQTGGARPFGVSLLIAGTEDGEPHLYEADPSGVATEWKAVAVGGDRDVIQGHLEEEYTAELSADEGVGLALEALAQADSDGIDPASVDVAVIDAETDQYQPYGVEDVRDIVADLDVEVIDEEEE